MATLEDFKDSLLSYLHAEQNMEKHDIAVMKEMSREEKIESNVLLADLKIIEALDDTYILKVIDNYSKLRSGDKVILRNIATDVAIKALIVDTNIDTITVSTDNLLDKKASYDLEADNPNLIGSLIGCLEGILPATPGAAFLRMLAGEESVEAEDFLSLEPEGIAGLGGVFSILNSEQQQAVRSMLRFYPIHILQGPPGTGKTLVLATTAIAVSLKNREVVIIANTHQAVNNALLKIRQLKKDIPLFKIGELLKAEELGDDIHKFQKFAEYNEYSRKNRRKKRNGYVIGMTIWGAISNLGLHTHSHFRPYMALVDEASLMPLSYASILGKCSSTICFFGDSRQMPPIFRAELENNTLSKSILDFCESMVSGVPVCVLSETHRMNKDITQIVSKTFYEPYGIKLHSAATTANNCFSSSYLENKNLKGSLVYMDSNISSKHCKEENEGEADGVVALIKALIEEGKSAKEIAVITPFRKQVRLIRSKINGTVTEDKIPLIDTVERLQGQDVECIILTFATSSETYIESMKSFIFNRNRLNVMISRAKSKVVIFASEIIKEKLNKILL